MLPLTCHHIDSHARCTQSKKLAGGGSVPAGSALLQGVPPHAPRAYACTRCTRFLSCATVGHTVTRYPRPWGAALTQVAQRGTPQAIVTHGGATLEGIDMPPRPRARVRMPQLVLCFATALREPTSLDLLSSHETFVLKSHFRASCFVPQHLRMWVGTLATFIYTGDTLRFVQTHVSARPRSCLEVRIVVAQQLPADAYVRA